MASNDPLPKKCEEEGSLYGLSTREAGRGRATPHMPVETAKCWWLLKIEPNAWAAAAQSALTFKV